MHFLSFLAPAVKPEPAALIIPDENTLIAALLNVYENPAVTTTAAMHLDVLERNPKWIVSVKRVRRLLPAVAAQHDQEARVVCGEDEVEDWCVIRVAAVVSKAASVSALWAARRSAAPPGVKSAGEAILQQARLSPRAHCVVMSKRGI